MDGLVGGEEGQTVGELEAFLRERAALPRSGGAQRGFVHQLKCEARFDTLAGLAGPTTEQIPGSQAQVLGDQQPKADLVATDLIGQQLAHGALEAGGITGLGLGALTGSNRLDGRFRVGTVTMEFFFVGRTVR